jgi:hypothetical protein
MVVEWEGEAGQPYQVERILELSIGSWTAAPSGTMEIEESYKPAGPAGVRQYADPAPAGPASSYRVTGP